MRGYNLELFIAFIALCVAAWSAHKTNQTSKRQAKQSWPINVERVLGAVAAA